MSSTGTAWGSAPSPLLGLSATQLHIFSAEAERTLARVAEVEAREAFQRCQLWWVTTEGSELCSAVIERHTALEQIYDEALRRDVPEVSSNPLWREGDRTLSAVLIGGRTSCRCFHDYSTRLGAALQGSGYDPDHPSPESGFTCQARKYQTCSSACWLRHLLTLASASAYRSLFVVPDVPELRFYPIVQLNANPFSFSAQLLKEALAVPPAGRARRSVETRQPSVRKFLAEKAKKDPKKGALLNAYELIRAALHELPKGTGPAGLMDHFRTDKDFKGRVAEAKRLFNRKFFRAAIKWIKKHSQSPNGVTKC